MEGRSHRMDSDKSHPDPKAEMFLPIMRRMPGSVSVTRAGTLCALCLEG